MKYRLIKKYPGSPEVGTIVEGPFNNDLYWYSQRNMSMGISADAKNHPEFWQPVVEKDYEILSFKCYHTDGTDANQLFIKEGVLFHWNGLKQSEDYIMKRLWAPHKSGYKIHSIKRLSDGEIFTINDKVNYVKNDWLFIKEFNLYKEEININNFVTLKNINHFKKPLFISEDGVEIFEGDTVVFINTTNNRFNITSEEFISKKLEHLLYFSTIKAAEEYILYNKPVLSLNDIKNTYFSSTEYQKLKELVKQKIK